MSLFDPVPNHRPPGQPTDRRSFLKLAAAAGMASATRAARGEDVDDRLRRFIAMRGAPDRRLVIGCIRGHYDGVVDGEVTPLFDVVSATFSRYRKSARGYEMESFEQAYFIDPADGSVLTQWTNPYTNQQVAVPIADSKPARTFIGADLRFQPAQPPPDTVQFRQFAQQSAVDGDEIVFIEKVEVKAARVAPLKPFIYNETTILRSKRVDVDSLAAKRAPCQTTFNAVVSWRPWLGMADRPGHMLAIGYGVYGQMLHGLPELWLRATARLRPELLADPEATLRAAFPESG